MLTPATPTTIHLFFMLTSFEGWLALAPVSHAPGTCSSLGKYSTPPIRHAGLLARFSTLTSGSQESGGLPGGTLLPRRIVLTLGNRYLSGKGSNGSEVR